MYFGADLLNALNKHNKFKINFKMDLEPGKGSLKEQLFTHLGYLFQCRFLSEFFSTPSPHSRASSPSFLGF